MLPARDSYWLHWWSWSLWSNLHDRGLRDRSKKDFAAMLSVTPFRHLAPRMNPELWMRLCVHCKVRCLKMGSKTRKTDWRLSAASQKETLRVELFMNLGILFSNVGRSPLQPSLEPPLACACHLYLWFLSERGRRQGEGAFLCPLGGSHKTLQRYCIPDYKYRWYILDQAGSDFSLYRTGKPVYGLLHLYFKERRPHWLEESPEGNQIWNKLKKISLVN